MSACRTWRGQIAAEAYGESVRASEAFRAHLASCESCREELAELRALVTCLDGELPPDVDIDIWHRLEPTLVAIDTQPARRRFVVSYPVAAVMAVLVLALGIGLGVGLRPVPNVPGPVTIINEPSEAALARYLERATPLLLAVANRRIGSQEAASFESGAERRLAERLAEEGSGLREALEESGQERQAALVRELEVVFLQISNLPRNGYREGLRMVQETVESRALLFQLSVEEMRRLGAPEA